MPLRLSASEQQLWQLFLERLAMPFDVSCHMCSASAALDEAQSQKKPPGGLRWALFC